jgi:hypothetical protein
MAPFGAPLRSTEHVKQAVHAALGMLAALEIQRVIEKLRKEMSRKDKGINRCEACSAGTGSA